MMTKIHSTIPVLKTLSCLNISKALYSLLKLGPPLPWVRYKYSIYALITHRSYTQQSQRTLYFTLNINSHYVSSQWENRVLRVFWTNDESCISCLLKWNEYISLMLVTSHWIDGFCKWSAFNLNGTGVQKQSAQLSESTEHNVFLTHCCVFLVTRRAIKLDWTFCHTSPAGCVTCVCSLQ